MIGKLKARIFIQALVMLVLFATISNSQSVQPKNNVEDSPLRTLNDKDFIFNPPSNLEEWAKRSAKVREQLQVSLGVYPMPKFAPLNPVTRIVAERPEYTVSSVYFESVPGLLVTGSLYTPKGDAAIKEGKRPAVLCPHGHWQNGRCYENSDASAKKEIETGAESNMEGARYPLQARCANLAMMGAVVFHYDMVGYADNGPISHRDGFQDPRALLHLQGQTQLQTINSIRALDYVLSMREVDPKRIGVTGASGGGTQTFLLGALDSRPAVAFPAVMVGSRMQGGCVCENAPYLRINTGNVEIAGLFYPRPLAMSGADDWTIAIEKEGLPELKKLYSLSGQQGLVDAKCWPEYGHNFNQKSREFMYGWMNRHLRMGGDGPVRERAFVPVPPAQLSVFDKEHPRVTTALSPDLLRASLEKQEENWIGSLNVQSEGGADRWKKAVGPFVRVAFDLASIKTADIKVETLGQLKSASGLSATKMSVVDSKSGRKVACDRFEPKSQVLGTVIWVGESTEPPVEELLAKGWAVLLPSRSFNRESKAWRKSFGKEQATFTYCYNRPALAEWVRDICTVIRSGTGNGKKPWLAGNAAAAVAGCVMGDEISGVQADLGHFNYGQYGKNEWSDFGELGMFLPGAMKFGGLPGLLASNPPPKLNLFGVEGTGAEAWAKVFEANKTEIRFHDHKHEKALDLVP